MKAVMAFISPDTNANPFKAEEEKKNDPTYFDINSAVRGITRIGGGGGINLPNVAGQQLVESQLAKKELIKHTGILNRIERKTGSPTKAVFA
jgi:hypothetical protein